ncbi:MAG: MFS transporter [Eggerthellaceae bacterium]
MGKNGGAAGSVGWKAFSGICVMSLLWSGIEWYCMSLYADPVVTDLGISRTAFMFALSLMAGISATVSLTCFGSVEQRFGVRRLLIAGGILDTLAFLVLGLANSLPVLYLGAILYGFGTSVTGYNMAATAVNHWFASRRGSMVGVANTVGCVSGIVFSPVIAALIAVVGWRMSFFVCFVLSVAGVLLVAFLYRGNPEDLGVEPLYSSGQEGADPRETPAFAEEGEEDQGGVPYSQAIRTSRFWILALAYFVIGMASYGIMSTMALFAIDFGYSSLQGVVVSVSLIASAVLLVPLGAVCDRFGSRWALTICCATAIIAALLLCAGSLPAAAVFIASACSGAAYNSTIVPVSVSVREAFGAREYSKKLGFCAGCATVGISAGPTVTSMFFDLTGSYHMALVAFAILCAAALFAFHAVARPAVR